MDESPDETKRRDFSAMRPRPVAIALENPPSHHYQQQEENLLINYFLYLTYD